MRYEALLKRYGHQKGRVHGERQPYSTPPLLAPCRSESGQSVQMRLKADTGAYARALAHRRMLKKTLKGGALQRLAQG